MMDLEASLGKQLLVRGKKKVTLTEDGAYLRSRAQEIISLMEKTEASFRESEQIITGDVYIGCSEHRSTYPIMQMINTIQEEYPDIRVHFSAAMLMLSLKDWIKDSWIWVSCRSRKSIHDMIIKSCLSMKHGEF